MNPQPPACQRTEGVGGLPLGPARDPLDVAHPHVRHRGPDVLPKRWKRGVMIYYRQSAPYLHIGDKQTNAHNATGPFFFDVVENWKQLILILAGGLFTQSPSSIYVSPPRSDLVDGGPRGTKTRLNLATMLAAFSTVSARAFPNDPRPPVGISERFATHSVKIINHHCFP